MTVSLALVVLSAVLLAMLSLAALHLRRAFQILGSTMLPVPRLALHEASCALVLLFSAGVVAGVMGAVWRLGAQQ